MRYSTDYGVHCESCLDYATPCEGASKFGVKFTLLLSGARSKMSGAVETELGMATYTSDRQINQA